MLRKDNGIADAYIFVQIELSIAHSSYKKTNVPDNSNICGVWYEPGSSGPANANDFQLNKTDQ
jgi:hypothetical protein